jgi:hypothetical protein
MSAIEDGWVKRCACTSIVIGVFLSLVFPPIGIFFLTITLSLLGVIYLAQTIRSESRHTERRPTHTPPSFESEGLIQPRTLGNESTRDRLLDPEASPIPTTHPTQSTPSKPLTSKMEQPDSSKPTLQARIDSLEKQVKQLRQDLSEVPPVKAPTANFSSEIKVSPEEAVEEEAALSERAIQQLLDALEQKLEKGSISPPLYDRLRNKYLTRLKKFKDRRVAASQQE